jgi:hypothetical protein
MKKLLILAPLALALAACGQTEPAPAPVAPVATAPEPATPATPAPSKRKGGKVLPKALPEGVELAFPYHYRNERTLTTKNGDTRQRVTVEYLDDDASVVVPSLVESMKVSGFRKMKQTPRNGGGERLVFKKKSYGTIVVDVIPDSGQKLAHKRAKGQLWLSWANGSTATAATTP